MIDARSRLDASETDSLNLRWILKRVYIVIGRFLLTRYELVFDDSKL